MNDTTKKSVLLEKYFNDKTFDELLSISSEDAKGVKETIQNIEMMMKDYAREISYTQIRNILQLVKNEEYRGENGLGSFYKVLPLLAYTEARLSPKDEGRKLVEFIRQLASSVNNNQYDTFIDIMNTIVAYHKLNS